MSALKMTDGPWGNKWKALKGLCKGECSCFKSESSGLEGINQTPQKGSQGKQALRLWKKSKRLKFLSAMVGS